MTNCNNTSVCGNTVEFAGAPITFSHDTIIADIHRELSAQSALIATIATQDSHFTSLTFSDSSNISRHHYDRFKAKLAHLCQLVSPVLYYLVQYDIEISSSYDEFVLTSRIIQKRISEAAARGEECIAGFDDVFDTKIVSIGTDMRYRYLFWFEAQKNLVRIMVGTLCLSRYLYSSGGYNREVDFSTCAGIMRYLHDN